MPTININGAQKNYGVNSANAVSDLDLEIRDGEFMCLLGPSGCGKTTTLRMIAGLENLSGGEIRIGDRVVDSVNGGVFVQPEKREMGLVFQSYALWPHMTIERNTDFGLRLRKIPKPNARRVLKRSCRRWTLRNIAIAILPSFRRPAAACCSGAHAGNQSGRSVTGRTALKPRCAFASGNARRVEADPQGIKTTIVFVTHDQWNP